jgi:hypothetical protein
MGQKSVTVNRPPRRGRPPKFGRRGEVVAVTLPEEVVRGLRRINADLGWAIVTLFEAQGVEVGSAEPVPDVDLATVGPRRKLIVVRRSAFGSLPGVSIIPLSGDRAFLALAPGHGMADLELAVADRLEDGSVGTSERRALLELRQLLRLWRRDPALRFETRAIIVGEVLRGPKKSGNGVGPV